MINVGQLIVTILFVRYKAYIFIIISAVIIKNYPSFYIHFALIIKSRVGEVVSSEYQCYQASYKMNRISFYKAL